MKYKNGFTLTELLAVIAIIAILTLMAVPAVINLYNNSIQKEMLVQEGEVKSAAHIFLTDYCLDPIDGVSCPSTMVKQNYICLSDMQEDGVKYISKVLYKNTACDGVIVYSDEDTYENGKPYLFCGYEGGKFEYATDMNYYVTKYSSCFVNNPKPTDTTDPEPNNPTDPGTPTKKKITISYIDEDASCPAGIEYYYQNYYFICQMSSRVIITVNGTKYTIKEALNGGYVTMDELIEAGFKPTKDTSKDYATE